MPPTDSTASFGNTTAFGATGATAFARKLALAHGVYWLVSGIWPILHRASFEWVTGPKTDFWLVETVGGLLAVIGAALFFAGRRGHVTREIAILGLGSCLVLTAIDVIYAGAGRISRIYFVDAFAHAVLAMAWVRVLTRRATPAR